MNSRRTVLFILLIICTKRRLIKVNKTTKMRPTLIMKLEAIHSFLLHIVGTKQNHMKAVFSGRYNIGDTLPQIAGNKSKTRITLTILKNAAKKYQLPYEAQCIQVIFPIPC